MGKWADKLTISALWKRCRSIFATKQELADTTKETVDKAVSSITEGFLALPTALEVDCPKSISTKCKVPKYIISRISPSTIRTNGVFQLWEGNNIRIHPSTGEIKILSEGIAKVIVYTPLNTLLAKEITINIRKPLVRLGNSGKIRLSSRMRIV